MPPTVALQIISSSWTKQSRGGRGAQLRNAVPHAFPFDAKTGKFSAQMYWFGESNDFAAPIELSPRASNHEVRDLDESLVYSRSSILCSWNHQRQTLNWCWSNIYGGAHQPILHDEFGNRIPLRHERLVAVNTWNRLRWMERFSDFDTGQWWYQHTIVNIAHFEGSIDSDVFVNSTPANEFLSLPILR